MDSTDMQNLNRKTMEYITGIIRTGMNLLEIRNLCENYMLENGADSFWYWDIGAFVFSGDETNISVSGKQYQTSNKKISNNDIITIDLSPQKDNIWGDYARTIIVENGKATADISNVQNENWKQGLLFEEFLHNTLMDIANPFMTFEELYTIINNLIQEKGFINLDFMGNLGHSIVKEKQNRIYIEKGNKAKLSDTTMFTFEPHISTLNSSYGFKREDIYYFKNGCLSIL